MKNVVMELKNGKAAVLDERGIFHSIKDRGYEVGQVINLKENRVIRFPSQAIGAIAAIFFGVIVAGGGISAYALPSSRVTLDVNPSLRYELNLFDKVIDMGSFNNDGQEVVDRIYGTVKGSDIETAIDVTMDELDKEGYLDNETTSVVITSDSRVKDSDELNERMRSEVDAWKGSRQKSVEVKTYVVNNELSKESEEKNISPGKLSVLHELKDSSTEKEYKEADWKDRSITEIRNEIEKNKKEAENIAEGAIEDTYEVQDQNTVDAGPQGEPDKKEARSEDASKMVSPTQKEENTGEGISDEKEGMKPSEGKKDKNEIQDQKESLDTQVIQNKQDTQNKQDSQNTQNKQDAQNNGNGQNNNAGTQTTGTDVTDNNGGAVQNTPLSDGGSGSDMTVPVQDMGNTLPDMGTTLIPGDTSVQTVTTPDQTNDTNNLDNGSYMATPEAASPAQGDVNTSDGGEMPQPADGGNEEHGGHNDEHGGGEMNR